ncbi:MAG: DUF4150 domain-containing protein [Pirellulaceae bacterium]|nr:DUF4150 domain-containing protein [Pirellulaceae bacterium]
MPATVIVNFMTVVHKASSGMVMVFPDVCKTPSPGGPIPIPYPNMAMSSDTFNGAKTVKCDGQPIMIKSSYFMTSTGDEPGVALGVVSNRIKGKAYPKMYSFDVKADGENVFRLADIMLLNGSSPTNTPPAPEIQPPAFGLGNLMSPKKRKIKEVKWNLGEACCGDEVKFEVKTENLAGKSVGIKIAQASGSTIASGSITMNSEEQVCKWVTRRGPWRKTVNLQVTASGYGKARKSGNLKIKKVEDVPEEIISQQRLTPQYIKHTLPNGTEVWLPNGKNYGWDMTYGIQIKRGALIVTKKINFDLKNGAKATTLRKQMWKLEIESIWDKKWKLHRKKCLRKATCNCAHNRACCMFPIRILCKYGAGHGKKVALNKGTNNPSDWGGPNWWYSHTWWEGHTGVPVTVRAHEFGHLIGMYDEYPAGACDPARKYTDDPTSIMSSGSWSYKRHMIDFHTWFDSKAKGQIGETKVLRW